MEDAGTSEEDDDIDSQDSNISFAANTPTATTPEDVSHSRGRNVEGKES